LPADNTSSEGEEMKDEDEEEEVEEDSSDKNTKNNKKNPKRNRSKNLILCIWFKASSFFNFRCFLILYCWDVFSLRY